MTDEELFKARWPFAHAIGPLSNGVPDPMGGYLIIQSPEQSAPFASGKSLAEAWANAVRRLGAEP